MFNVFSFTIPAGAAGQKTGVTEQRESTGMGEKEVRPRTEAALGKTFDYMLSYQIWGILGRYFH